MTNAFIPAVTAIVLYLAAGGVLARGLFTQQRERVHTHPGMILSAVGFAFILHSFLLYSSTFTAQGLNLGIFNAFSLVTWLIILMLLVAAVRRPITSLGVALFPLAALAIILELTVPIQHLVSAGGPWQLRMHILFSFLAYSLFTIAMVQSIVLYIQDKNLRNHQPGGFIRSLPPLQSMEFMLFQLIMVGYILLTVSLISGGLFLEHIFTKHLTHKTLLSILAWLIFSVLLWGRYRHGWRGRKAIRWTLGGFLTLMLAYFGSKLVLELILKVGTTA